VVDAKAFKTVIHSHTLPPLDLHDGIFNVADHSIEGIIRVIWTTYRHPFSELILLSRDDSRSAAVSDEKTLTTEMSFSGFA
jgi:hypothetical protein